MELALVSVRSSHQNYDSNKIVKCVAKWLKFYPKNNAIRTGMVMGFKASTSRWWLGVLGRYPESKVGFRRSHVTIFCHVTFDVLKKNIVLFFRTELFELVSVSACILNYEEPLER